MLTVILVSRGHEQKIYIQMGKIYIQMGIAQHKPEEDSEMEDVQFFPRSVSLEKEQNRGTFRIR